MSSSITNHHQAEGIGEDRTPKPADASPRGDLLVGVRVAFLTLVRFQAEPNQRFLFGKPFCSSHTIRKM